MRALIICFFAYLAFLSPSWAQEFDTIYVENFQSGPGTHVLKVGNNSYGLTPATPSNANDPAAWAASYYAMASDFFPGATGGAVRVYSDGTALVFQVPKNSQISFYGYAADDPDWNTRVADLNGLSGSNPNSPRVFTGSYVCGSSGCSLSEAWVPPEDPVDPEEPVDPGQPEDNPFVHGLSFLSVLIALSIVAGGIIAVLVFLHGWRMVRMAFGKAGV